MRQCNIIILLTALSLTCFWSCDSHSAQTPDKTTEMAVANNSDGNQARSPGSTRNNNSDFTEDYTNTDRVIWQKPDVVINLLGDLKDKTVLDIGAGTGFFSLRLTPKAKKVIAIDISPYYTNYLDSVKVLELPEEHQDKLETRLALPGDPKLAPEEVDIAVIVNTYMHMDDRIDYLEILHEGVSKGGTILIIDFKKKRTPIGPAREGRIPLYKVEEELYEAGFRNVQTYDNILDYQYIVMGEK